MFTMWSTNTFSAKETKEIAYEMLILVCVTSDNSNQRVELHILGFVHTEH